MGETEAGQGELPGARWRRWHTAGASRRPRQNTGVVAPVVRAWRREARPRGTDNHRNHGSCLFVHATHNYGRAALLCTRVGVSHNRSLKQDRGGEKGLAGQRGSWALQKHCTKPVGWRLPHRVVRMLGRLMGLCCHNKSSGNHGPRRAWLPTPAGANQFFLRKHPDGKGC